MAKSTARLAADARYEAARVAVLVRLTRAETEAIDRARGALSRPAFMRAAAVGRARRKSESAR